MDDKRFGDLRIQTSTGKFVLFCGAYTLRKRQSSFPVKLYPGILPHHQPCTRYVIHATTGLTMARRAIGGNVVPGCWRSALVPCSPPGAAVAAIANYQPGRRHIEYCGGTLSPQLRWPGRPCGLPFPSIQARALIRHALILFIPQIDNESVGGSFLGELTR